MKASVEEFKIEMINTISDSNSSPNPRRRIGKGTNSSPHPETENWGDSCMFPSCKNTKKDSSKVSVTQTSGKGKKLGAFWIIALILIAFLGGRAYFTYSLWHKFKSCSEGQKKQQKICLATVKKSTSAQEILRGVADAQTNFNDTGGVGGRLGQIIIANFFGNQRCKRSGSSR